MLTQPDTHRRVAALVQYRRWVSTRVECGKYQALIADNEMAIYDVFELTKIPRPRITAQGVSQCVRDGQRFPCKFLCSSLHEVIGKKGNLFPTLAQWRQ